MTTDSAAATTDPGDRMDLTATDEPDRQEVTGQATALLTDVRVGGHPSFDRVVFEFAGSRPGHDVRYVPVVVHDGTGEPVALAGRAFLQVSARPATGHDEHGTPTGGPLPAVAGFAALRDIADAGDFEAVLTWGIGVASRTPFQVRTFNGPSRIAVDVAHAPPGTGNQLLRLGDRGAAVATWQWRLRLALGRAVAVDEDFGPTTQAATRDFQRQSGLADDGVVGPRTRTAMERALDL